MIDLLREGGVAAGVLVLLALPGPLVALGCAAAAWLRIRLPALAWFALPMLLAAVGELGTLWRLWAGAPPVAALRPEAIGVGAAALLLLALVPAALLGQTRAGLPGGRTAPLHAVLPLGLGGAGAAGALWADVPAVALAAGLCALALALASLPDADRRAGARLAAGRVLVASLGAAGTLALGLALGDLSPDAWRANLLAGALGAAGLSLGGVAAAAPVRERYGLGALWSAALVVACLGVGPVALRLAMGDTPAARLAADRHGELRQGR